MVWRKRILAVDFDDTLYDSQKRKLMKGRVDFLIHLVEAGYNVVCYTSREDMYLKHCIKVLRKGGLKIQVKGGKLKYRYLVDDKAITWREFRKMFGGKYESKD